MGNFLLLTKNGTKPPTYQHREIGLAVAEAKRLHELHKTDVLILEVVGEIKSVEVPVTRTETKVEIDERLIEVLNDLPF